MMGSKGRRPELHIEVLLKDHLDETYRHVPNSQIASELVDFLHQFYVGFYLDDYIDTTGAHSLRAYLIESVQVVDYAGPDRSDDFHNINELDLVVYIHELHDVGEPCGGHGQKRPQTGGVQERMLDLPSKALAGIWDSLEFDTIDPSQILKSIARIIVLMKQPGLNLNALDLNRLILLHGPPGCGKTTLCRALAQKLTIRLGNHFTEGKLFEINTQSLLSKYYSESGRLISQMFERILTLAASAETLICVLIDEVESIAGSREQLSESGECHDSIRATNQLLTALDRIRAQPNVIVFCTSNLKKAIDPAFLDRVDYQVAVPSPCESAVYEILRSTINQLMKCGLITSSPCEVPEDVLENEEDRLFIPHYHRLWNLQPYPECPGMVILALAVKCKGFSGRRLKKLPLLAITTYTWGDMCPLNDALMALRKAVDVDLAKDKAKDDVVMD